MKMTVHLFDPESGLYRGQGEIDLLPNGGYQLEPGMTEHAPPVCPPGMYARRGQEGWELVSGEDLRRAAYVAEADIYRDQGISYAEEAKALSDDGRDQDAHTATVKAAEARANYLAKKEEIRARYPDTSAVSSAATVAVAPECLVYKPTGTYHRQSCTYATGAATLLSPMAIAALYPNARPCGHCQPQIANREIANE